MCTINEKVDQIEQCLEDEAPKRLIKKDKGLIERTESSLTYITEENKTLLMD